MDIHELMSLVKMMPPRRPQGLGQAWPGHDLPGRGAVWGGQNLSSGVHVNPGEVPMPPQALEPVMPRHLMTPEISRDVPYVPTAEEMRPAFNPGLRIGTNEAAQQARASRESRAADLMRLLDAYDVMPGQEKWF